MRAPLFPTGPGAAVLTVVVELERWAAIAFWIDENIR
jgi:hypothetical protein